MERNLAMAQQVLMYTSDILLFPNYFPEGITSEKSFTDQLKFFGMKSF